MRRREPFAERDVADLAVCGQGCSGGCPRDGLLDGVVGGRLRSAGGGLERLELVEGRGELGDPGPVVVEVELGAASGEREPAGDMQQPVAQALGFGLGELTVQQRLDARYEKFRRMGDAGYQDGDPSLASGQ